MKEVTNGTLELIGGGATAPSTTLTAIAMAVAGSNQIKAHPGRVWLLPFWVDSQAAGICQIRSARMHDGVNGLRTRHVASEVYPLIGPGVATKLYTQDTLTIELTGSGTAGDIENFAGLIYYEGGLAGSTGRFIDNETRLARQKDLVSVENAITAGTAGGFSGGAVLGASIQNLKANTDYALLGFMVSTEVCSVSYMGPDTGGIRVGGPGHEMNKLVNQDWFVWLSNTYGRPLIPVINSANRGVTIVEVQNDENANSPVVTTFLAELA